MNFPTKLACVDLPDEPPAMDLVSLATFLGSHPAVVEKAHIWQSYDPALEVSGNTRLGDDCAAIANPSGTGHLLFAAEGMLESFVEDDPWFAGYSAVMVNLSDVAAMGGRAVAITDVLWTPGGRISEIIWSGMRAAAAAYGVPIVGGHTSRSHSGRAMLGAAVLGHAGDRLITSFDARPGDRLVIAIDMHGSYQNDKPFWNASTLTPPERLRADLEMLPLLAEKGLCRAGKDISNGGIIGTLAMLCDCSGVGVVLDLGNLPCPPEVDIRKWLISFPSYGFLLAISEDDLESTISHFSATEIICREIGHFTERSGIALTAGGEEMELVNLAELGEMKVKPT
ncbi:MAG: sll0787 family AIR synthase-like protein [Luteolibacter sp.]